MFWIERWREKLGSLRLCKPSNLGVWPFLSWTLLMDSIIFWNSRGACGSVLLGNLKEVMRNINPLILILVDTRCTDVARLKKLVGL